MEFSKDVLKRFGSKVDFKYLDSGEPDYDQCWEWNGYCDKNGYGIFAINSKSYRSHRFSYMAEHLDEDISNLCVCHRCDNPPCVNPNHLWSGTIADNTLDMVSKNRHTQGSDMYTAKLTEETVREILVKIYNNYYIDILQISNDYNVSDSTIYAILDGKYWKKVISSVIIELDVTLEELHDRVIKHQLIESEVIQIKKLLSPFYQYWRGDEL